MSPARRGTAHNGTCEIYFDVFGNAANPTLLLVNGLGSQCINYADEWCEMFAAEGLQVVRYDNRDVGLSSTFEDAPTDETGAAYRVSDMVADGIAVLDELGVDRAHVMGLSMGGMIVQNMAILHPDRLLSLTSVMSATGEPEYRKSTRRAAELLTAPSATTREGFVQQSIDGLHEWGSPEFADEARWRAAAEQAFDRSFIPTGTARQYMAILASGSWADRLPGVTAPTLVIHGDKDTLIDQIGGRRTAELIPGARFELIEGMGHDYPPQLWRRWTDLVVGHVQSHS
jgi:pimeloyl-ACP methyl ester carboxylesterase